MATFRMTQSNEVTFNKVAAAWHLEALDQAVEEVVKLVAMCGSASELDLIEQSPYVFMLLFTALKRAVATGQISVESGPSGGRFYRAIPAAPSTVEAKECR